MKNVYTPAVFRVFLPFAAGYFISYLYRVVNAVIGPDLASDLVLGPASLGLLTSTYFISFASFQLPLGVLLDRYGPKRTEAALLLFAGLGALVFSKAQTAAGLMVGRALIGFGVSACLMAAFKAYTMWFPRKQWPLINGFQMASGGLGVLAATSPVEAMLGYTDWRGVFTLLAFLTFGVAVIIFTVVPERRDDNRPGDFGEQLRGVRQVFTSLSFWRTAPVTTMSQASFLAIHSLWSGPWLRDVAGMTREQSASVLFWVAVAMIAGWISLGGLAARLDRKKISITNTAVTGMACFMAVQLLLLVCPVSWALPVWLLFGYFGTTGIIAYAGLTRAFDVSLSGRVTTALNLLVFVTAFIGQWAIGWVIGLWPQGAAGGYAEEGFRAGFSMMLVLQAAALLWFFAAGKMVGGKRVKE